MTIVAILIAVGAYGELYVALGERSPWGTQRIPVIWKRRRVGKAKGAHRGQALVGTAREERAFAHPTSDSSRPGTAVGR